MKFIYYCPKCGHEKEVMHKIGITLNCICNMCKTKMKVKLQPVYFEVHGYSADNGYSRKEE